MITYKYDDYRADATYALNVPDAFSQRLGVFGRFLEHLQEILPKEFPIYVQALGEALTRLPKLDVLPDPYASILKTLPGWRAAPDLLSSAANYNLKALNRPEVISGASEVEVLAMDALRSRGQEESPSHTGPTGQAD